MNSIYKNKSLKSKIDILLPLAVAIITPMVGLYSSFGEAEQREISFGLRWSSSSIVLYFLWYVVAYFSHNFKEKFRYFLMILFGFLAVVVGISYQLNYEVQVFNIVRLIFALTLILIIQYALRTQKYVSRLLIEKEQIQTENYKVQLKALHTKIDPHFLFNSLNTLRSMVRQQHTNSEKFILSLSDFYRQTLKYNEKTSLQLSEELTVLASYLFLMKNRNESAVSVDLNIEQSLYTFHLPTLALQVVVENCFKHNSMTSKMPLQIEIANTSDSYIIVSNNRQPKISETAPSGTGLDVLRKRYELMGIEQGVVIEKTVDQFKVKLKLISK